MTEQQLAGETEELKELILSLQTVLYRAIAKLKELEKEPRVVRQVMGGGLSKTQADSRYVNQTGDTATYLGITDYLDMAETTPPANPAADILRLYVEDFKGFPFFSFRDATGMTRKLVRDSVFVGKNVSGDAIPAARAVYASGSAEGVPTIAKAKADAAATMPCIGVTLESVADGAFGRIMQVG